MGNKKKKKCNIDMKEMQLKSELLLLVRQEKRRGASPAGAGEARQLFPGAGAGQMRWESRAAAGAMRRSCRGPVAMAVPE